MHHSIGNEKGFVAFYIFIKYVKKMQWSSSQKDYLIFSKTFKKAQLAKFNKATYDAKLSVQNLCTN